MKIEDSNITSEILEILKIAVLNGTVKIDDVQRELEMKERTEILEKHQYKITQGKDGKWRTYLPDSSRKNNRRQIKKATREKIEEEVVKYYRQQEQKKELTLEELYPEWLKYYSLHVGAVGTVKRVTSDWKRFYQNDKLIKMSISKITKVELDVWAHEMVKHYKMTKTCYFNMSMILRKMMNYALEMEYISYNPFEGVKVDSKLFYKKKKPANETQVYTEEEEIALVEEAWKDYLKNPEVTTPLAVILLFYLGVRVGEVVALKDTDIHGNTIEIESMERRVFQSEDGIEYHQVDRQIVENTKTPAGNRKLPVVKEAMDIIKIAIAANQRLGYKKDFYLFTNKGKRITDSAVRWRVEKYCKHLGIAYRSPHKIRKTYISKLIDLGISINTIREFAGHVDEKTTYHSYCFDRKTKDQTYQELEKELTLPVQFTEKDNILLFASKKDSKKVIKGNQILPA